MQFSQITVGIPREIMPGEKRVAAIPATVSKMKEQGATVLVEKGAGEGAFISDEEYFAAGAEIVGAAKELYDRSKVILKVKEVQINSDTGRHEAEMIREDAVLIGFMHPANPVNHTGLKTIAERGITSFTLDGIPRISRAQKMDALTAMSTVAGYKSAIFAAGHLGRFIPMMPTSFGLIKPAQFLVIGTGVAGLQAIATAKRLGAKVKAVDIRPEANEQAKSLGAEIINFDLPAELAVGAGGYALRLPEEWYEKEKETLAPHIEESDAIVLTALIPGEIAPILIDQEMVSKMKKGSVIVDIAVDQGGNCSLTRPGEEYCFDGISISGIMNIPATLPVDATYMFAHSAFNFLAYLVEDGAFKNDPTDEIIGSTLVTNGGKIVHKGTLLSMG